MKKIIFIFVACFFSLFSCSGETNLLFLLPSDAFELKTGLNPAPPSKSKVYLYRERKIAELQNSGYGMESLFVENYFSTNKSISKKQLLSILNSDEKFVIQRNYNADSGGVVESSYRKICVEKYVVGEYVFYGPYNHGEAGGRFLYCLSYLEQDKKIRFAFGFDIDDADMDILNSLPEIFIQKKGNWYWKNGNSSVEDLYKLMVRHDERLPKEFLEMQSVWENIISNLKIDGKKIELK